MRPHRMGAIGLGLAPLIALVACGSRTGLLVPAGAKGDGGAVLPDGRVVPNGPTDAGPDVIPTIDAQPLRDVNVDLCRDAGATLVYAVTAGDRLLRFDPPAAQFATIGALRCGDPLDPFSMAVDRQGLAYVLYSQPGAAGRVYHVSLVTAACMPTTFTATPEFGSFGMGFSADDIGTGETLYVASDNSTGGELGAIDPKTLDLTPVAFFDPPITGAELSGTGDGRLFAFYTHGGPGDGGAVAIAQIDKATARVVAEDLLPGVDQGNAWAFAFWGGDFYLFTAPDGVSTTVQRFRPRDGSITHVADYPERIVGAGVSTCAPER